MRISDLNLAQMEASLTEAIGEWLDSIGDEINTPLVGENALSYMAQSAMAVLKGIDDVYTYMDSEDMLKDE